MPWTDPETGQKHSIYSTPEFEAEIRKFNSWSCPHANQEAVWVTVTGGSRQLRNQCLACGELIGNAQRKENATSETKAANLALRDTHERLRKAEYNAICRRHVEIQATGMTNFKGQHAAYLRTQEWKAKRQKVMERARNLCEGCREQTATVVHHLTYEHWRNELLFELVALCDGCHARCHEEDMPVDGQEEEDGDGEWEGVEELF